jgi:hypothetical protein
VALAIIGMDQIEQIDQNVAIAARFQPLTEDERQQLIAEVQPLVEQDAEESQTGKGSLFWLHDTKVMGWQTKDEPMLVAY